MRKNNSIYGIHMAGNANCEIDSLGYLQIEESESENEEENGGKGGKDDRLEIKKKAATALSAAPIEKDNKKKDS